MDFSLYNKYLIARYSAQKMPLTGVFELTSRCNLDCRMCYIHKKSNDAEAKKRELSTEEWMAILEAAQKRGLLFLLLTGGEPLLRPDFKEIYLACHKKGILVSINTNGTLIDEDMADFFYQHPPMRINITLYGSSPATYETLCGHASAYEKAYRAVQLLRERKVRIKINTSVTPLNAADTEGCYRFCKENGLDNQTTSYMFPPVRSCEMCDAPVAKRLTPAEEARYRFAYDLFRFDADTMAKRTASILNGEKLIGDEQSECNEFPTERIRCRAGQTSFWITFDGQMRPCGMMTEPGTDVRRTPFDEAWSVITKAREQIMIPPQCTACKKRELCESCPAVCYAETGDFAKTPTYMCEAVNAYLAEYNAYAKTLATANDATANNATANNATANNATANNATANNATANNATANNATANNATAKADEI